MDKEVWKDVKGYEGLYQVSNLGRVRSLDRVSTQGERLKGKVLTGGLNRDGYLAVVLCRSGGQKNYFIHRLVAQAFLENPDNLPEVNHKNEDKTDNTVANLEWCSHRYNMNYGTHNERAAKGHEKPVYVITASGHRYYFSSIKKAAALLRLHRSAVSDCLNGRHKHHHGFSFEWAEQHA